MSSDPHRVPSTDEGESRHRLLNDNHSVAGARQPVAHFIGHIVACERMRTFVRSLGVTPPDLANRIEQILASVSRYPVAAGMALESLIGETVQLVET